MYSRLRTESTQLELLNALKSIHASKIKVKEAVFVYEKFYFTHTYLYLKKLRCLKSCGDKYKNF